MAILFLTSEVITMIFINDVQLPMDYNGKDGIYDYLKKKQMILISEEGRPLSNNDLTNILLNNNTPLYLHAKSTSSLLREFKEELYIYINKVTDYIDTTRDSDDHSTTVSSYSNIVEALFEFIPVTKYLQKNLIDTEYIHNITERVFERGQSNDYDYILDIIEYELLEILQTIYNEIQEVM